MNIRLQFYSICCLLVLPVILCGQEKDSTIKPALPVARSKAEQIDTLLAAFNRIGQFNGAALVAENGKLLINKGYGLANMQWSVENNADTRFLLASVSKQFTAVLVLQQVEKGLLRLDGHISDYLDYYPVATGRKISIHHLLSHSSGLPDIMNLPDFDSLYAHRRFDLRELLALFYNLRPDFEPGTKFSYSNSGYSVLAAILEKVTGTHYEVLLRENITKPLGMLNTGIASNKSVIRGMAAGYRWSALDRYINPAFFDNSISIGSGGIYSTTGDMFIWDQALYTNKLLGDSMRKKMLTPNLNGYGYGFFISQWKHPKTNRQIEVADHGGANSGYQSMIYRLTTDRHLLVLLCNTNDARINFIRNRIRSILYELPYDPPDPELRDLLAETLRSQGIDAVVKKYHELKASKLEEYGESEFIYNISEVGYSVLLSGYPDIAIRIYQLNVEAFPRSVKALDDLGEAYLFKGHTKLALQYYKRALEIDKNNPRIKNIVDKIHILANKN